MTPHMGLVIVVGSCHSSGILSPSSHVEALVQSEDSSCAISGTASGNGT